MKNNQKAITCLTCMEVPVVRAKTLRLQEQFRAEVLIKITDQKKGQA
jgi:hypothetical protein